ncbi:MAG: serine/threonine protein kinase [Myxococcales bacterium]|nr:serine/threonine protein kinase [Myxococcales bacterium]
MIGRVVGKYKILDQIGEGGMGIVYRAEHVVLGSPAAVKVLLPQFTREPVVVDRFFTEAKAASSIKHVGITEVFDYGRLPNDQAFIAMELLRGEDLTGFLGRHGRLDPSAAVEIVRQLLAALNAAHVIGVVHRDLKPDNIFLTRDTGAPGGIRVKVLDFGIAKLIGDQIMPKAKTKGGAILGTPAYMAPEQCRGGVEIDARADLYAVGCILFELLAGRPPFVAEGGGETMAMHIYEVPPKLSDHVRSIPPELEALVAKMLTKAPDDRTPSAAWALAALERVPLPTLDGIELALATHGPAQPLVDPEAGADGESDEPADKWPLWIPVLVILVAIAIAGAAVYFIGLAGDDKLTP